MSAPAPATRPDVRRGDPRSTTPTSTKLLGWKARGGGGRSPAPNGRRSSNGRSTWACPAPTLIQTAPSRRSRAASCRTSPASTPSSRRPTSRTCAAVGEYDAAVLGAPFDGGTTYRPGTRFGPAGHPQDLRALQPVQLRAGRRPARDRSPSPTLGDIFTIPGNIEKTFDQITKAVAPRLRVGRVPRRARRRPLHRLSRRVRGVAPAPRGGNLGIIHFDRHVDTQETDLDERMHTTPWFHATNIPNVPAKNLVQIGIGGWQVAAAGREGRPRARHHVMTVTDCVEMGIEKHGREWRWRSPGTAPTRSTCPSTSTASTAALRPRHRLARAGRLPAARGAQVHPASPPKACWPAWRSSSARRPTTTPRSPR